MAPHLLLFTLSDGGTIAAILSALVALAALVLAVVQARRARESAEAAERAVNAAEAQAEAAGRSVAAAELQAAAVQRAAAATEEQVAALREGLDRQEQREQEQRSLIFPRLRIVNVLVGPHVTISHVSGESPATRAHVVLVDLTTQRFEGDLSLLPRGETENCRVERVDRIDTDYFADVASALNVPFRVFVGVIWTSPTGGRGRFAGTLGDDSKLNEILDEVDAGIPGY